MTLPGSLPSTWETDVTETRGEATKPTKPSPPLPKNLSAHSLRTTPQASKQLCHGIKAATQRATPGPVPSHPAQAMQWKPQARPSIRKKIGAITSGPQVDDPAPSARNNIAATRTPRAAASEAVAIPKSARVAQGAEACGGECGFRDWEFQGR